MQKIHNYLLERQLCENEFVSVHIAVDLVSQKRFTLSIVNEDYQINPVFLMKVISGTSQHPFTHPHIAKIIDYGEVNYKQYFVSEFLGHKSLASFLDKPVPATFALDVISQLASGLHYISLQGYIHGHIRPDNILFDKYGNVILSTTLLISNKKDNIKSSDTVLSRYQSPEVIAGKNANECSDLYSLGVMFFELLTGEHFGERESNIASTVDNVNELIPYLPKDSFGFQPIINKLLAKNPKQRYQTGLELLDALNDYESKLVNTSSLNSSRDFYESESDSHLGVREKDPENTGKKRYKRLSPDLIESELFTPLDEVKTSFFTKIIRTIYSKTTREAMLVSSSVSLFVVAVGVLLFFDMESKTTKPEDTTNLIVTPGKNTTVQQIVITEVLSTNEAEKSKPNELNNNTGSPTVVQVDELSASNLAQLKLANVPPLISALDLEFTLRAAQARESVIVNLLNRATQYKSNLKFTTPVKKNAYAMYIAVLNIDPENTRALEGIFNLAEGYAYMAKVQLNKKNYGAAKQYIDKGLTIQDNNKWLLSLKLEADNRIPHALSVDTSIMLDSFVLDE